ncbi:MAG: hypothetical protein R3F20_13300 [Planctomycetota bacterium]
MRTLTLRTVATLALIVTSCASVRAQGGAPTATLHTLAAQNPDYAWLPTVSNPLAPAATDWNLRLAGTHGGTRFGILPSLRLLEPNANSSEHALWAQLVNDFPWLWTWQWGPGQTPPAGPNPTPEDYLLAVGMDELVNAADLEEIDLPFLPASPLAIRAYTEQVRLACRHWTQPILSSNQPAVFDPTHADWNADLYGAGRSPLHELWLATLRGPGIADGETVPVLGTEHLAQVALGLQAPSAAELNAALDRLDEITEVGYEISTAVLFFTPEPCVSSPATYPHPEAVPVIDEETAAGDLRFGVRAGPDMIGGFNPQSLAPVASASSWGVSGEDDVVFIPVPLSSVNTLIVDIPLAGGGVHTLTVTRLPFEAGFLVTVPSGLSLDGAADWNLRYPPVGGWPGFPLAPIANPMTVGIPLQGAA